MIDRLSNSLKNKGRAAHNTGLAKVAVQSSADTFVVNQSLVLRINIFGANRHLRQARKPLPPMLKDDDQNIYIDNLLCSYANNIWTDDN